MIDYSALYGSMSSPNNSVSDDVEESKFAEDFLDGADLQKLYDENAIIESVPFRTAEEEKPVVEQSTVSTETSEPKYEKGSNENNDSATVRELEHEDSRLTENSTTVKKGVIRKTQVRDFPLDVAKIALKEFPTAKSRGDAIAAYIIAKSGANSKALDISSSVRTLLRNYKGDRTAEQITIRLDNIERHAVETSHQLNQTEALLAYLLMDRLGFLTASPSNPSEIKLTTTKFMEFISVLRAETNNFEIKDKFNKNRPK